MEEWKTDRIENLIDALIDYRGKTPQKDNQGIPLITAKIVKNGRIDTPEEFLAHDDYDSWMRRGYPQIGDVVLTTEAPLGEVAQISYLPVALAQRIVTLRGKEGILDSTYLKYFLQSEIGQKRLSARETGTTVTGIKQSELRKVEITYPSFPTQRKIASILKSIDEKIELNNHINHNLEEQADGIVSSLLNVGTTVLRLSDICKYVSQKIDCQSLTLDNYISTENMVPSRGGVTKSSNVPTGTAIEYSSGDILVSNIRPYFQKIWKATYSGGCSNDVLCFRSSTNSPSFLYHLLRQNSFFDHVMAGAKGSKMPRGDKAQIMNWTFVLSEDWEAMESKLSIIDKKVALLRVQNLMLIELRDSVLPRLMSGELKINDLTC